MQMLGIKYKSDKAIIKEKIQDYEQKLKSKYKNIDELFKIRKISQHKKKKFEENKTNKPKDFFAFKLNEDFGEKQNKIEGKDDEKEISQKISDKNKIIKDINEDKKEESDSKVKKEKETIEEILEKDEEEECDSKYNEESEEIEFEENLEKKSIKMKKKEIERIEENMEEEEINEEIDFEQMSYRDLLKLEKSGLLKGRKLLECQIRLKKNY